MDSNQEQKHFEWDENAPHQQLAGDWTAANRQEPGGTVAESDAIRSDLAIKNYQSEDTIGRANKSAKKQLEARQGRKAEEMQHNTRSRSQEMDKRNAQGQKRGLFNRMFGKLSKNEQKQRKKMSAEAVKLPKNFAELVLDLELLVDSGNFDINTINKLMQLYSQAVEYYSGMNDVRYVYYTERIQNMLVRPEILRLMKDGKVFDEDSKESALERARRVRTNMKGTRTLGPGQIARLEQSMEAEQSAKQQKKKPSKQVVEQPSKEEVEEQQRRQQEIQMQKRKSRHERLLEQAPEVKKNVRDHEQAVMEKDVVFQNDMVNIESQKKKAEDVIKIIKTDENDQKSDIQRRIEERKKRMALNRSVNAGEMKPQFGGKQKNKSFILEKGFVPQFGGSNPKGGLTPDRLQNKSENSSIGLAAQHQESANSGEVNQATKGSSTTLIDAQIKQLKHTREDGMQDNPRNLLNRPKSGAQTIILKSNNPFDLQGNNVSVNFDIQSKSSAVFFNEDELQEFEEMFQKRIQEVWATIEQKQDKLQQDYQTRLEQIYEEVTQIKFEKIAEVKLAYKDKDPEQDKEAATKMEEEIQQIKDETEALKIKKITKVQEEIEVKKKEIQAEKTHMLSQIKNDLKKQKELQNQQDQQELNQAFDYINMDDGFDPPEKESPGFGSAAQNKQLIKQEVDRDPAADREKFKAPDIKKNSEMKKGKTIDYDKMKNIQADNNNEVDDFDKPRERTFTFSKALGEDQDDSIGSPQMNDENSGDIESRKELLKKELMSLQEQENK